MYGNDDGRGAVAAATADWLQRCVREGQRFHARTQPALRHNALNLACAGGLVAACAGLLLAVSWTGTWAWVPGAGVTLGLLLFALFVLVVHEASHGMFLLASDRALARRLNRLAGWCTAVPFFVHYGRHWEVGHLVHHQRPLTPEDPQAANRLTGRALAVRLALYLSVPGVMFVHRLTERRPGGHRTSSRGVLLGFAAFWCVVLLGLGAVGSAGRGAVTLALGFQVLGALNQLKGALEHGGGLAEERDMRLRSRTSLFPGRALLMPFNISLHFEHHLHMAVPWYLLPRYHRAIVPLVPPALRPRIFNRHPLQQLAGSLGATSASRVAPAPLQPAPLRPAA